jgi:hypothetical protein
MEDPFIDELERLTNNANASVTQSTGFGPTSTDVKRWTNLFNYNDLEARCLIQHHRDDVIRNRISDAHWDLVREEREALGYDREAYEHVLQISDIFLEQAVAVPGKPGGINAQPGESVQIIRIGGILKDAEMVKEIGGLDEVPHVMEVISEEGIPARLCCVPVEAKRRIKEWLVMQRVPKQVVRKQPSSDHSAHPAPLRAAFDFTDEELKGVDETLPQCR